MTYLTRSQTASNSKYISILVGPEERRFVLFEGLARQHSQLFNRMLTDKTCPESQTRLFRLPNHDTATFSVLTEWLLHVKNKLDPGSIANRNSSDTHLFLLKCYILALDIQAYIFMEFVLGEIQAFFRSNLLTLDHVRYVYENTHEADDLLRRYCIWKMCAQTSVDEKLANEVFFELSIEGGPFAKDYFDACEAKSKGEGDLEPFMLE